MFEIQIGRDFLQCLFCQAAACCFLLPPFVSLHAFPPRFAKSFVLFAIVAFLLAPIHVHFSAYRYRNLKSHERQKIDYKVSFQDLFSDRNI